MFNTKWLRIIASLGFVMLSSQSIAAAWYPVAVNTSMMIFVDKDSVKKKGNEVTFWQWQLFGRPIGTTDSVKSQVVMDCKAKQRKSEFLIAIADIDTVQQEGKVNSSFEVIQPNSLESGVYEAVCNNKFSGQPQKTVSVYDVRSFMYQNAK